MSESILKGRYITERTKKIVLKNQKITSTNSTLAQKKSEKIQS